MGGLALCTFLTHLGCENIQVSGFCIRVPLGPILLPLIAK